jgi:AcrR family transcriptional regulator
LTQPASIHTVALVLVEADGRRLRRTNNRDAVIDALLELFDEGVYEPSAAEIAERAGLSPRSLFRYFDDTDDLTRAAIARQLDTALPLVAVAAGADDPLEVRVRALVESRAHVYDAITPGARAARICAHRNHLVAAQVRSSRSYLRAQLRRLFAPELSRAPHLLAAVDVLCSFESYDLLRTSHRLSRSQAVASLTAAVSSLLSSGGLA